MFISEYHWWSFIIFSSLFFRKIYQKMKILKKIWKEYIAWFDEEIDLLSALILILISPVYFLVSIILELIEPEEE